MPIATPSRLRPIVPFVLALAMGCAPGVASGPDSVGPRPVLGSGKFDGLGTASLAEFKVSGVAHAALPADYDALAPDARAAVLREALDARVTRIADALRDAAHDALAGAAAGEHAFFVYVEPTAARAESAVALPDGRARFPFSLTLIGPEDLGAALATNPKIQGHFTLGVDAGSVTEYLDLEVASRRGTDVFPAYAAMLADGVLDVSAHFGFDGDVTRRDRSAAERFVADLLGAGWTHPDARAASDLNLASAPFSRTLVVSGATVSVHVRVLYADQGSGQALRDAFGAALASADLVFYAGQSTADAPLVFGASRDGVVARSDLGALVPRASAATLVLAGASTATALHALASGHTDLVSLVMDDPFRDADRAIGALLASLTLRAPDGSLVPRPWKAILAAVGGALPRGVQLGLAGTADNPRRAPLGGDDALGQPCANDLECGADGNYCLALPSGDACGVGCADSTACPEGFACVELVDETTALSLTGQCARLGPAPTPTVQ